MALAVAGLVVSGTLGLPRTLLDLQELFGGGEPDTPRTEVVCNHCIINLGVTDVTPWTNGTTDPALTVPSGGGPPKVHPPPAPERPDHKESKMNIYQGAHVIAEFPGRDVKAVVLEVRGSQALVQEKGTDRAEWIPVSQLR